MAQITKPLWKLTAELAMDAERKGDIATAERQSTWSLTLAQHAHGTVHEDVGEAIINLADF